MNGFDRVDMFDSANAEGAKVQRYLEMPWLMQKQPERVGPKVFLRWLRYIMDGPGINCAMLHIDDHKVQS